MRKFLLAACGAASLAMLTASSPAMAQQSSVKAGDFWTAGRIEVEDGQFENYMDYLTKVWGPSQEYAKSQGWISEYHIFSSLNPRDGEANVILLTRHADIPSAAEAARRDALMNQFMKQDDHSSSNASGDRKKMRNLMGSILYQEQLKR